MSTEKDMQEDEFFGAPELEETVDSSSDTEGEYADEYTGDSEPHTSDSPLPHGVAPEVDGGRPNGPPPLPGSVYSDIYDQESLAGSASSVIEEIDRALSVADEMDREMERHERLKEQGRKGLEKEQVADMSFEVDADGNEVDLKSGGEPAHSDDADADHGLNVLSDYQVHLMCLKRIAESDNDSSLAAVISNLIGRRGIDSKCMGVEDLESISDDLMAPNLSAIRESAPEVLAEVHAKINGYDAWGVLSEAGYDPSEQGISYPAALPNSTQVMMAFEDEFEINPQLPIRDRLVNAKNNFKAAMSSEKGKLAVSGIALSVAVGLGSGIAAPIAAIGLAGKLIQNKKVQSSLDKIQNGVDRCLQKLGASSADCQVRKERVSERLARLSNNRWLKAVKLPLAACAVLGGVGSVAIASDIDVQSVKEYAASLFKKIDMSSIGMSLSEFTGMGAYGDAEKLSSSLYGEGDSGAGSGRGPGGFEVEVSSGDTAWGIAEDHFVATQGHKPTTAQIVAMVNDMGLEDPNLIHPGDVIKLPSDLAAYDSPPEAAGEWLGSVSTQKVVVSAECSSAMESWADRNRLERGATGSEGVYL